MTQEQNELGERKWLELSQWMDRQRSYHPDMTRRERDSYWGTVRDEVNGFLVRNGLLMEGILRMEGRISCFQFSVVKSTGNLWPTWLVGMYEARSLAVAYFQEMYLEDERNRALTPWDREGEWAWLEFSRWFVPQASRLLESGHENPLHHPKAKGTDRLWDSLYDEMLARTRVILDGLEAKGVDLGMDRKPLWLERMLKCREVAQEGIAHRVSVVKEVWG